MFKRLMQRSRQAVVGARKAARTRKHNYLGNGQIPRGPRREQDGLAARAAEPDNRTRLGPGGHQRAGQQRGSASPCRPGPSSTSELPDLARSSLEDLDELIDQFVDEELAISHRRRIVHAKLDILWTERENRPPPTPGS